ncbi:MAG: cell envelope integrity protein TolA [Proteobacteria bacterium]|nr:cell envelope integrity protein TolA [Pseudomonadota bacterium]
MTREPFMPRRPRGLGLGFVLAVLAHVLLILALAFGVNWHSRQVQGVEAELWAAVPQFAAPPRQAAPEPAPVVKPPAPAPEPPKSVPRPEPVQPDPQIAIEKAKKEQAQLREQQAREEEQKRQQKLERDRQEQQQREQAKRDQDKRDQEKREAAEKQQRELQEKKREQQDLAAQKAARDAQLKRMMNQVEGNGGPTSTGNAARTAGPSANYAGRVAAYLRPEIKFDPASIQGNPDAVVEVRVTPDGRILSRRLVKSSGVPAYDDAVLRALDIKGSLPPDVNGLPPLFELTFRPRD